MASDQALQAGIDESLKFRTANKRAVVVDRRISAWCEKSYREFKAK
jgi:hypothetical protein